MAHSTTRFSHLANRKFSNQIYQFPLIRPAEIEDCPEIAELQVEIYQSAYASLLPASYLARFSVTEQSQNWQDWFSQDQSEILLVAESKIGELCSYVLGRPGIQSFPPYQSELVALHVRQSYQRQGIGRRLATEVADRFIQAGCSSMMLWVLEHNPARQFYKRLGGRVVGRQTIDLDDNGTRAVEIAYGWEDISMLVKPDPHA